MGYIPKDAKWWIADLVEEITIQGDSRNVVHRNTVLIRADSAEEAYKKALLLGREGNLSYQNASRKRVRIRFRGIAQLDVIHDELQHGAELFYSEEVSVPRKQIQRWVKRKRELEAFRPHRFRYPRGRPDYGARDIMEQVNRQFGPYPDLERLFKKFP